MPISKQCYRAFRASEADGNENDWECGVPKKKRKER
jgi:hypothetical protein